MPTFKKEERLSSKKAIEQLFAQGNSFQCHPFRIIWKKDHFQTPFPARTAFSVPKKHFKKAVHRNLLKRRMREAFRKNKHLLYNDLQKHNIQITAMFVCVSNQLADYSETEQKIILSLQRLTNETK